MREAAINTFVDGVDAGRVNLWDVPDVDARKKVLGYLKNGDVAKLISESGDYVLLKAKGYRYDYIRLLEDNNIDIEGWCRKEFLKQEHDTTQQA